MLRVLSSPRAFLVCRAFFLALLFLMSAGLLSVRADAQSYPQIPRGTTGQARITSTADYKNHNPPPPTVIIMDSSGSTVYGPAAPSTSPSSTTWNATQGGSVTVPPSPSSYYLSPPSGIYTFQYYTGPTGPMDANGLYPYTVVSGIFEVPGATTPPGSPPPPSAWNSATSATRNAAAPNAITNPNPNPNTNTNTVANTSTSNDMASATRNSSATDANSYTYATTTNSRHYCGRWRNWWKRCWSHPLGQQR